MEKYYWLNNKSRKFLSRGYLEEGVTPEQRIREVSEAAEKILGINGFADKFEDYMARGFYSLSTPIINNFGNKRGLPVSCVVGDTWINTQDGGGKMAKDIQTGDYVLTHKGRYKKVLAVIPTKNKDDIFKLKVINRMTPLYLTGNHLVLTNLGWVRTDELNPYKHLVAINGDIEYEETDHRIDLKPFCKRYDPYIIDNKICKKISDNTRIKTSKNGDYVDYVSKPYEYSEVDEDLAWAIGFWFAEGSITIDKNKNPNGIRVTYNNKDEKLIGEKWFNIICSKFSLNGNIYESSVERNGKINSWMTANVNSNIIGEFFKSFGNGCKEKLIPEWVINLPKNKLQHFLDGLLLGDGTETSIKSNRITVSNPKMLLQIYQIGLKLGHTMSLQMQEKAGKLATTRHVYTCTFRQYKIGTDKHLGGNRAIKFSDGLYYAPIKEVAITEKNEDVYDFTVEDDHSFSAAGVILHNCFNSYIQDSIEGMLEKVGEVGIMSKMGGGTSGFFGDVRARGENVATGFKADGPVRYMELYDTVADIISQGSARRGSFAAYLPVEHPDILEFLKIRDAEHPIQQMSIGVTISDEWMQSMLDGDKDKRKIWAKIIKKRFESGYPYISFIDTMNNNAPQVYKDKGLKIKSSNLCNEISLFSDKDYSFVCVLMSINVARWDEIIHTDAIETAIYFLEAVNEEFVRKTDGVRFMESANRFAKEHRALGLGVLGYHTYLKSKMIPFESMDAKYINIDIFEFISKRSLKATRELADIFGEAPIAKGYGIRNVTTMAVAPTTSSSFILGQVDPSIEPCNSNYFVKKLAKGTFAHKDPKCKEILKSHGKNDEETWMSILQHGGSVQHLDFLTDLEKQVLKTFGEISQKEIVIQAAQRQKFIDQGQSLNILIPPNAKPKDVSDLLIFGWQNGVKGFYYQRSANPSQELSRDIMNCTSCES